MKDIQVLPLLSPADYQSAGSDLDSINMGLLHQARILITLGAITGNDTLIQLYAGATAGAKTTEIPFTYQKSGADTGNASADVFGAWTDVAVGGLTFTSAANYDNRVLAIDVSSDDLPAGKQWLTVAVDDGSASVLLLSAVAVGLPRYEAKTPPTAL